MLFLLEDDSHLLVEPLLDLIHLFDLRVKLLLRLPRVPVLVDAHTFHCLHHTVHRLPQLIADAVKHTRDGRGELILPVLRAARSFREGEVLVKVTLRFARDVGRPGAVW